MATTGILGWLARIAAVVSGVALLLVTCVISIPVLLLAWPVHVIRRRGAQPLGWMGSLFTTVIAASAIMGVLLVVLVLQHTKTGTTVWHDMMASASQANASDPPPPPAWMRYFPGAAAGYHRPSHSTGVATAATVFGLIITAELFGVMLGSIAWSAAWLVVSGWTGRFAFVTE